MNLDQDHKGVETIELPGILNLSEAGSLTARLLAARGSDIIVDASGVELLGAPCAQVLVSALKTWKADGRSFDLRSESAGFLEGVGLLGLSTALEVGV